MKAEHTPGPWRYESSTKTIRAVPQNYWLASMDSWDGAISNEANAALIAAAPDLLRACLAASAYLTDPPSKFPENRAEAARIIEAAIRKARPA